MANKSNLNVVIDNGTGIALSIVADASGYLVIEMSDGKGTDLAVKLNSTDAQTMSSALSYANALRRAIPQS